MTNPCAEEFRLPSGLLPEPRLRRPLRAVGRAGLLLGCALALASAACNKKTPSGAGEGPAAAAPSGAGKPYHFAFITNNSADFWNIAEKGLRKAEKDFGVTADVYRPLKGEVADQQRFLEDIMVKGYDGAAISPINPDALTGTFARVAAKMPLVCHDSDAPNSKRSAYVGTNNVEAGRAAGAAAIEALKAAGVTKGQVGLFVGRIDAQNAVERKKGVDETLGKMPGIEILPVFLDKTDRALAKKNVEDALARYPELVLMIGIWSYNGPCMAGAVRSSSRAKKPILIAFDEDEETQGRHHHGQRRAAPLPDRVPRHRGAAGSEGRQEAAHRHRHGHLAREQGEPRLLLERAARAEEMRRARSSSLGVVRSRRVTR